MNMFGSFELFIASSLKKKKIIIESLKQVKYMPKNHKIESCKIMTDYKVYSNQLSTLKV